MRLQIHAGVVVGLLSAAAAAAEPEASFLELSYSQVTEDGSGSRFGVNGATEYRLGPSVNWQINAGANYFGDAGEVQGDLSAHAIYNPLSYFAMGVYAGFEGFEGYSILFGGIEGRFDFGDLTAQVYTQIGEADGIKFRSGGTSAHYVIRSGFGVGIFYDQAELPGSIDFKRYGVSADYRMNNRYGFFAKAGATDSSGSGGSDPTDAGFIELGVRMLFGGNGQTTFDRRAAFGILPGG